jgi:cupin fold WbuC family metalloprotein
VNLKKINPEVFFATDRIVTVEKGDLDFLDKQAENSSRRRARICTHRNADDKLHEMTVTLKKDCYLIPEKHIVKVESYHIIEGMADVVIFDKDGNITDVVEIGDYSSGRPFYFRLSEPSFYHTLIIRTNKLVYHETATGPFQKSDTLVAPWAPGVDDIAEQLIYMSELENRVEKFVNNENKK